MPKISIELGPLDVLRLSAAVLADSIPELPSLVRMNESIAAQCRTAGRSGCSGHTPELIGPPSFSPRFGARMDGNAPKGAGSFSVPLGEPAPSLFEMPADGSEPEIERLRR